MATDTQIRRWDALDALAVALRADAGEQVAELEELAQIQPEPENKGPQRD
jgi:hypothetical protein